jgi:integrase/recombinase XerD
MSEILRRATIEPDDTPALPSRAEDTALVTGLSDGELQILALWLHGKSPGTVDRYAYAVEEFLFDVKSARGSDADRLPALVSIGALDVKRFADRLEDAGYAPRTINARLGAVKSLCTFLDRIGVHDRNEGSFVETIDIPEGLHRKLLSKDTVRSLIEAAGSYGNFPDRNRALLELIYASGCRVSEVCNTQRRDVISVDDHPNSGRLKGSGAGFFYIGEAKGQATRVVRIRPRSFAVVNKYKRSVESRDGVSEDWPLFPSRKTNPETGMPYFLRRQSVWRIVKQAADAAGIEAETSVTVHSLRHAHASHALDGGAPVTLVRDGLGHRDIRTTSKYLHARPDESSGDYL